MRLFLTGASGFIGAEILRLALEDGHEVTAPIRPCSAAPRLAPFAGRFTRIDLDLRDVNSIAAAMAAHRPEAVLHLAWWGVANAARLDYRQMTDNVTTAYAMAAAAAATGVTAFIGLGSQGEYGTAATMTENELPAPTSLYGAAKVAALFLTRQLAAQSGMRHAWLRLFSAYGPGDNSGWLIPMLIIEMLAGRRPRTTLGTQSWDWLHVKDAARGILAAATTHAAEGVFNLGSGRAVLVRAVIERIRDLTSPGMDLIFGEIPFSPDQVVHMQADITLLCRATGWAPCIPIEEGLADTVAWYRARQA